MDVFNALDDQQTIRVQDVLGGSGGFDYLEDINFVEPKRYFIGGAIALLTRRVI